MQYAPIIHYITPQVWGACAPCFSPWYTRILFLFPSQGHFWLFVEFCGWLLPALLVLVFGLCSIAGYTTLQYQKHTSTSGYCLYFARLSFTRSVFSHPHAWIGFQWQLGRTLCGFMLPPYSLVACFALMTDSYKLIMLLGCWVYQLLPSLCLRVFVPNFVLGLSEFFRHLSCMISALYLACCSVNFSSRR